MDLKGKTALVTGASRGIGKAIALALAKRGARVVITGRSVPLLDRVDDEIRAAGGEPIVIPADLTDEAAVVGLFVDLKQQTGRLDIMVNNAGVGHFGPLKDFAAADFDRVIATNLRGLFLGCREAMRLMVPQKSGYIINIASVTGFKGYKNQAAYSASKHGVMGLTKSLAVEAQEHNIRVSAILPGGVDTELIGDARPDLDRSTLMHPEDVAQCVLYLLSLSPQAAVDQIYIRRRSSQPF